MTQKTADRDTTIEDINRERQRMAEKFGGDINAILEDARKRQEASGKAVWKGPPANKALLPTARISDDSSNSSSNRSAQGQVQSGVEQPTDHSQPTPAI